MADHNDRPPGPVHPPAGQGRQNWGLLIGVGIIMLCTLAMTLNLSGSVPRSLRAGTGETTPPWVKAGRAAGLVLNLGLGGWLLWRLLGSRPAADQLHLKSYLAQAAGYTRQIEDLLRAGANGHEQQLLAQMRTWQETIEAMAQALANLGQNDRLIQGDLGALPEAIAGLERQLAAETDALLRADLEQMLAQRRNQRLALQQLQTTRRRAELQIERTISVLSTIYSQLLIYRSTSHMVDYQHLADDVAEEVQDLQDYLEALQEVKGGRPVGIDGG